MRLTTAAVQTTAADRAAARRILGLLPEPDQWATSVLSSDGHTVYEVVERPDTRNGGTYMFCPCVAWSFQRGKGKDCRHVLQAKARRSRGE